MECFNIEEVGILDASCFHLNHYSEQMKYKILLQVILLASFTEFSYALNQIHPYNKSRRLDYYLFDHDIQITYPSNFTALAIRNLLQLKSKLFFEPFPRYFSIILKGHTSYVHYIGFNL